VCLVAGRPAGTQLGHGEGELRRAQESDDASQLGRCRAGDQTDNLAARDGRIQEKPREHDVVKRHRFGSDREVDSPRRDEGVEGVEVLDPAAVHLHDPALTDLEGRCRVVGAGHCYQTQLDVFVGEAVEIDALLIHESHPPHGLVAHRRT